MFQECGSKPSGNSELVDDGDKPKGAMKLDKLLTGAVPAVDVERNQMSNSLKRQNLLKKPSFKRASNHLGTPSLRKIYNLNLMSNVLRQKKSKTKPAEELVATQ